MNSLVFIFTLILLILVLVLLFLYEKNEAKTNRELYKETCKRNEKLAEELGKLQAMDFIRGRERHNADEKITAANNGSADERFNAINDGLRDKHGR